MIGQYRRIEREGTAGPAGSGPRREREERVRVTWTLTPAVGSVPMAPERTRPDLAEEGISALRRCRIGR